MTEILSESLKKGWGDWEIRVLVTVSLVLQSVLVVAGSRRKHLSRSWLKFLVWIAYLSADWVATVALSLISIKHLQYGGEDVSKIPNYTLMAFWAPFLLLHLGGPDTITAYSLEDNQLCWRHFLMLLVQVSVALHVFLRAWKSNFINYLSIPMFITGVVKFGERSWVLRCSNGDFFRTSMFPSPDPGPNYARFMEDYRVKTDEGYLVSLGKIDEAPIVGDQSYSVPKNYLIRSAVSLQDAFAFFKMVKRLFADLILSHHDVVNSQFIFNHKKYHEVFEVIEIELGFMFDVLYTKTALIHSKIGCALRFVTIFCTVSVFLALCLAGESKQEYSKVDVIITYVLLIGAMCLEAYSILHLLSSDWTMLWLSNHKNAPVNFFSRVLSLVNLLFKPRRWSNIMAQYSLIKVCRKENSVQYLCCRFLRLGPLISHLMKLYLNRTYVQVPVEIKELIFDQLTKKSYGTSDFKTLITFCSHRGKEVLEQHRTPCSEMLWSVSDTEFEESVLLWHIATDLCYHENGLMNESLKEKCKLLSNYMMYLLVMTPSMMPNGIGQIRFQDTCAELVKFFHEREPVMVEWKIKELLEVCMDIPPSEVKGDRSKSVLFDACRLANDLQLLDGTMKWKVISQVWVEMLCYAANQCRRTQHAQNLSQGGELLTHVWLLMAHLGITEQFQISNGHTRARLNLH